MAAEMADSRVGLVTAVLAGRGEQTAASILENLQLNSFIAAGVCSADVLTRHKCVIGKNMLLRQSDLQKLGGWRSVRHILAEDYVLGRRFEDAGYLVRTAPYVVDTINETWTLKRFANRHLRWAQMRRRLVPFHFILEPLLNPVVWSALVIAGVGLGLAPEGVSGRLLIALALVAVGLKMVADGALAERLRGERLPLLSLLWVPAKDLLAGGIWLVGAFRRRVWWRGNVMWIGPGTRLMRKSTRKMRQRARAAAAAILGQQVIDARP
jgi:ceramide glucosyltransferase